MAKDTQIRCQTITADVPAATIRGRAFHFIIADVSVGNTKARQWWDYGDPPAGFE